jgi:hypothetical protein
LGSDYRNIMSQDEINNLLIELDDPEKFQLFREKGVTEILGGAAMLGGGALKSVAKFLLPKSKKGKIIATGIGAVAGGYALDLTAGGGETETTVTNQAVTDQALADAVAAAQAAGIDISTVTGSGAGTTVLGPNFTFDPKAILGANDVIVPQVGGVYVGKQKVQIPLKAPSEVISIAEWKNQFPIGDPQKLAEWKKTLVEAGVVSASAGLDDLKKQWEIWGQFSVDSVKSGNKLTPYQLLAIQKGLWGGGTEKGPAYSTQLLKKSNSRELLKRFMEADTGRIISDEEADEFADLIRKKQLAKPTKTETKMVKGKKVSVTTPGFGEAEAAKIAEQRAMQDPLYAEFQTSNVFGTALEKALGVRG